MASNEKDPRHHTQNMQKRLREMIEHLRADVKKVDEPQLKAMFETSAEVLGADSPKRSATTSRKTSRPGARRDELYGLAACSTLAVS
jgi:hypothetical protein